MEKKPPNKSKEGIPAKQLQTQRRQPAFTFNNVLVSVSFIWKQMVTRILKNANFLPKEKTKNDDTATHINPGFICSEMCDSVNDEIAGLVIDISRKYKLSRYSTPLALKIIELVKKYGGFNLQASKEFYVTAPSVYFNLFRSQEGLTIINQTISILVEAVDTKMAQARNGVDQGNTQVAQKATENILKLCDLLIKSEQAARKALEEVKTSLAIRKHPMAIC